MSFPSPGSPECSLVPPVLATIPIRIWPNCHPSCTAEKGAKKEAHAPTIRILPVRPPGHALPRLSFSDNSIIARQERAIKVTLGYFKILWDTFLDNMLAKVWKPVSFPSPDSPECSLVPPVPAVIPIRLWPYRHPSCPARKGCKKGSACADGSNPPGSPSRPRPPGHALPATPSRAFPFLTILS